MVGKKVFTTDKFEQSLRKATGVFTAERHPEWRTPKDVSKWLREERKAADRKF